MPIWSLIWIFANVALVIVIAILSCLQPTWLMRALHRWQYGAPKEMGALSALAGVPILSCRCGCACRASWRGPEIADLRVCDPDDGWIWHLIGTADAPRCPSLEHEARRVMMTLPVARARR